jgi:NNMT/PNMT/TEMT family
VTRSPFFADFPARLYLEKYYSRVGSENAAFFRAVASSLESVDELGTVVELGGGPSLSALFAMTAAANCGPTKVIWTDVAKSSHAEIELWLRRQSGAFEYSEVLRWIEDELGAEAATVARRIRAASWELRALDLFQPLPEDLLCIGDVVGSFFVAEAASSERDDFIAVTTRVAEAARPQARVTRLHPKVTPVSP